MRKCSEFPCVDEIVAYAIGLPSDRDAFDVQQPQTHL
jgi:hypothetical protein